VLGVGPSELAQKLPSSRRDDGTREPGRRRDREAARNPASEALDADAPSAWDAYWTVLPCRHTLFSNEARYYVEQLAAVVTLSRDLHVLDFGCGSALAATMLAAHVGTVAVWDRSAAMRRLARSHLRGVANAAVIDLMREDVRAAGRYDLILINSVLQYMPPAQLAAWLPHWRAWLTPSGRVVVSDIVPDAGRRGERLREALDVLMFHARRGALRRAACERLSDVARYWRAARSAPLTRFDRDTLCEAVVAAGFRAQFLAGSLTCRPRRLAMVLTPT
jgi:SAM-dependent methyltransferase